MRIFAMGRRPGDPAQSAGQATLIIAKRCQLEDGALARPGPANLLTGAGALGLVAGTAGIHAWAAGAIGTMTLAIMTRASLGQYRTAAHRYGMDAGYLPDGRHRGAGANCRGAAAVLE